MILTGRCFKARQTRGRGRLERPKVALKSFLLSKASSDVSLRKTLHSIISSVAVFAPGRPAQSDVTLASLLSGSKHSTWQTEIARYLAKLAVSQILGHRIGEARYTHGHLLVRFTKSGSVSPPGQKLPSTQVRSAFAFDCLAACSANARLGPKLLNIPLSPLLPRPLHSPSSACSPESICLSSASRTLLRLHLCLPPRVPTYISRAAAACQLSPPISGSSTTITASYLAHGV
jgi:hypothetical protein